MASMSIEPVAPADSDILYEVVQGEIVEVAPMGAYEALIASLIDHHLQCYIAAQRRGWIVPEMLFDFSRVIGKKRRPDLAFVSYERWPRMKKVPRTDAWDVIPSLAIEVVSATNPANDVVDKVADYFEVGVERVWVVYPSQQQIYVYTSPTNVRVLTAADELTNDTLLPGFRMPLKDLFDDTSG